MSPGRGSTPRQTDWLTVSRKVTWTWTGASMIHEHASSKWTAVLLTSQPAPPEIASQLPLRRTLRPVSTRCTRLETKRPFTGPQFSPDCYKSVRGCRCEYRHPTHNLFIFLMFLLIQTFISHLPTVSFWHLKSLHVPLYVTVNRLVNVSWWSG
jgi:hypothetical protein